MRANTTAYTSGTPVGNLLHDKALDRFLVERSFSEELLAVPTSATQGAAVNVSDGEQLLFSLSGTFVATVQLQISLSASGSDWHNWGDPLTAGGTVRVPRGMARRVRVDVTAYTSGTPAGTLISGFAAESIGPITLRDTAQKKSGLDYDEIAPETVTSGVCSLLTVLTLLSVTGTVGFTLDDGLYEGQIKMFACTVAASTPIGTLTPANFVDGTSLNFDATTETAIMVWTAAGWKLTALVGSALT